MCLDCAVGGEGELLYSAFNTVVLHHQKYAEYGTRVNKDRRLDGEGGCCTRTDHPDQAQKNNSIAKHPPRAIWASSARSVQQAL